MIFSQQVLPVSTKPRTVIWTVDSSLRIDWEPGEELGRGAGSDAGQVVASRKNTVNTAPQSYLIRSLPDQVATMAEVCI